MVKLEKTKLHWAPISTLLKISYKQTVQLYTLTWVWALDKKRVTRISGELQIETGEKQKD